MEMARKSQPRPSFSPSKPKGQAGRASLTEMTTSSPKPHPSGIATIRSTFPAVDHPWTPPSVVRGRRTNGAAVVADDDDNDVGFGAGAERSEREREGACRVK